MQRDFKSFQLELSTALAKAFKGRIQNGLLEVDAQRLVDEMFSQRKARNKLPTIDCGLTVVGCNLGFELGQIKVAQWLTRFDPDRNDVHHLVPSAVALGYVNEFQLYAEHRNGLGYLVARKDKLTMVGWCPVVQGVPSANSVLFVALERARSLGYLGFLQGEQVRGVTKPKAPTFHVEGLTVDPKSPDRNASDYSMALLRQASVYKYLEEKAYGK